MDNVKETRIEKINVESSTIKTIEFQHEDEQLNVEFNSGSVYKYLAVPQEEFEKFKNAESFGKYLNKHIKGIYKYEKI